VSESRTVRRLKVLSAAFLLVLSGSSAFAQSAAVSNVQAQLSQIKGSEESAFCYSVQNGEVEGINAEKPVKIASVMKLVTSFWAIEALGSPNYRWTTRLYYQPATGELHVEGSGDPFFTRDRLYLLVSDLNKAGIRSLNRVTADSSFKMGLFLTDIAFRTRVEHVERSQIGVSSGLLMMAFNTSQWKFAKDDSYARARDANGSLLANSVELKTSSADVVSSNPLSGQSGVRVFEIQSAPLRSYLKRMNIMSANPIADELYHSLGGKPGFKRFLGSRLAYAAASSEIESGSGLPIDGPPRRDTLMSCANVIRTIRLLDQDLQQKHSLSLADITLVSGIDTEGEPTFEQGSGSLAVKTGTVNGAKNLAGIFNTNAGSVYFGIFMQGKAANDGARAKVLAALMSSYNSVAYQRAGFQFLPLDSRMTLRESTSGSVSIIQH
jgi:serine-type D-Ala-D-Ala carboxypeptidase/endopeptidase (penicillin-binding protein 4)